MKIVYKKAKEALKMYEPGDLIVFQGLNLAKHLNGKTGVIISYIPHMMRYKVHPTKAECSVAVNPVNLTQKNLILPGDDEFKMNKHTCAAFWPHKGIPVQGFCDWPKDWTKEIEYLKQTCSWEKPFVINGITVDSNKSPNFVIYFDAGDNHSPVNMLAEAILSNLPLWEQSKVKVGCGDSIRIRGVCILCYDLPTVESDFVTNETTVPLCSSEQINKNELFSLQEMQDILYYLLCEALTEN